LILKYELSGTDPIPAVPETKEVTMNIDRFVFAVAGSFILLSVALSQIHSIYWLFLRLSSAPIYCNPRLPDFARWW
jgi:hypothetical protein